MVALEGLRARAVRALSKKAVYGPDVDVEDALARRGESSAAASPLEAAERVGLAPVIERAGYVQVNEEVIRSIALRALEKSGVIVLPLYEALEKLPWARSYYWRAVPVDLDKYTAAVEVYGRRLGYFIYVPPGVKVEQPIYTCLLVTREYEVQLVHNIVVVDENAEATVITGCAVPKKVRYAIHIGVSEFYVKRNATLRFAMIHAWGSGVHVRPRTGVVVEDGGRYVSYYTVYGPVASLQTYPTVTLHRGASFYSASVVVGEQNSLYDVGTRARLVEPGASAEIVSRVVASDESKVYARARIEAYAPDTRGHIECLGLPLSPKAHIESIPELSSTIEGAELTHEAAIGRIAEEQLEYLMARGFSEEEARSLLLRGYLHVELPDMPDSIRALVAGVEKLLAEKARG